MDDDEYVDPHSRASGVSSREMMLLEISRRRRDDDDDDGHGRDEQYKDPHSGPNSREMMMLEIKTRAGDWFSKEEGDHQHQGHDDDMGLLPLQPLGSSHAAVPQQLLLQPIAASHSRNSSPRLRTHEQAVRVSRYDHEEAPDSKTATSVTSRSPKKDEYQYYGGEESPGYASLQLIVRAVPPDILPCRVLTYLSKLQCYDGCCLT